MRDCSNFKKYSPASGDLCRLLMTSTNSLDPDQDRQKVGPDQDPNCFTSLWYEKKRFRKKLGSLQQKHEKIPSMQELMSP